MKNLKHLMILSVTIMTTLEIMCSEKKNHQQMILYCNNLNNPLQKYEKAIADKRLHILLQRIEEKQWNNILSAYRPEDRSLARHILQNKNFHSFW